MKNIYKVVIGLAMAAILSTVEAQNTNAESGQNVDTICFSGLTVTPKIEAELAAIPLLCITPASSATVLPDGVDNSKKNWFREIFFQVDGCCGQAAGVGYAFTYEVNRMRGLEANVPTHQYPTHFTYNFLNEEFENRGSWPHDGWDVIKEMGVPSVEDYGGMFKNFPTEADRINVWETGYNHYYHALTNKVVLSYSKVVVNDSNNLDTIKHWLNDHGNGEPSGGLAVFCANVFNYTSDTLSHESDSAGQWVVTGWGNEIGGLHAMTIVGYDDNIMYDFNGDGQFTNEGNIDNWERGAFIVVNSWGTDTWLHNSQHLHHNEGYLYVPYRLVAGFHGREVYCLTVTDTYTPEIVLKARVQHPSRLHLEFYADYDTDATQPGLSADRPYSALNWPKSNAFNNLSMRGLQNNNSPIELGLDFGQFFKEQLDNGGIGKVFLVVKESNDALGQYDGEVTNFSLVDYRWNEIFELPYPEARVSIENNGDTRLGINYHLLPFEEDITSDFSMLTDRVARRTVTVDNGTFTINNGVKLDMYGTDDYDCNLVLNTGTNLVIGDDAVITAKRGNCLIDISGEVQVGNNVRFVADYGATLLVRVNHGRILHLNNCRFENASLLAEATKSISDAAVSSYIPEISVTNCKFIANSWNKEFAIKVDGYTNVTIMDDTICGLGNHDTRHYNDGIIIQNSGNLANNSRVMRNVISGCTGYGLTLLAGRVNVLRNHITACAKGVCLLNNSTVNRFRGNCAALSAEQTQYIHDNDIAEVFVARGSVPQEFRFNHITNSNNAYFVQYDGGNYDRGTQTILDLEYNNWGINEGLDARFNAVNMGTSSVVFDYLPKWNWGVCLDYYAESIAMEQMGDSLWSNGFYTSAKLSYKEILELFPTSISADNAMKKLFLIECFSGQDFTSLQNYYRTNSNIQNNDDLKKLASYLSNKCDEEMKNYDAAIAWYENIISDTTSSVNDSIFATIDLGFLYLVMQDEGNKAMGKMKEFIPKSVEAYSKQTNYALHHLKFNDKEGVQGNDERLFESQDYLVGIYPNPADNQVRVTGKHLERIEVINVIGQRIISKSAYGVDSIILELDKLISGIYFVNIIDNNGECNVRKLIIE